jgi:hypothetical protein
MPWPLAAEFAAFINDVDLIGTSFDAYAKDLVSEVLAVGRAGTLIDWQANNSRTCITRYQAEKIVNWRLEHINGRLVPTLIVLGETAQSLKADASACESFDQRRVLKLVPLSQVLHLLPREGSLNFSSIDSSWAYVVEVWQQHPTRKTTGKMEWLLIKTVVPLRRGRPLPFIPFVFHGPRHSRPDIDKPPLNDLIAVNLDHYRLDADYKHGLHYTALPTAWVSGFDKASNLKIGSSTAWVTDITGAAAGFLEFRGHGLTSFERALDRDERLMAVMGSRLLEDQKKVGETAQAIELRQSGENSILSNLASSLSQSLTQILRWVHWWHGFVDFPDSVSENEVLVTLNTDFSTKGISSDDLQAIVSAWQNGAISQDTMFELFRKGEILPDGRSNPDEAQLIKSQTTPPENPISTHAGKVQ